LNGYIYTSTISSTTYKMTISSTGNFSLKFATFLNNSIGPYIGFTQDSFTNNIQVGDTVVQLFQPNYYFIDISELPISTKSSNDRDFGTFVINSTVNTGSIETWSTFTRYHIIELYENQNIYQFNIKLKSYDNKIINLNGAEWSMILRLYY